MQGQPDFDGLIQLVESLYLPGSPENIKKIQADLQNVQKSPYGWELASRLIDTNSPNCQFFGVQTINVKLNRLDIEHLPIDIQQLLPRLLQWLCTLVAHDAKPFVIKKLLSVIVLLFSKFPDLWHDFLPSLTLALVTGQVVTSVDEEHLRQAAACVGSAPDSSLVLLLLFCQTLVEDLENSSIPTATNALISTTLVANLAFFIDLVKTASARPADNIDLTLQSLTTASRWISYFIHVKLVFGDTEKTIRVLFSYFLSYLDSPYDDVFEKSAGIVTDLYSSHPSSWPPSDKARLLDFISRQGHISNHLAQLSDELDDRTIAYGRLLIAVTQHASSAFISHSGEHPEFDLLLRQMVAFADLQGLSIPEDTLATEVLEFWSSFVEDIVSESLSTTSVESTHAFDVIGIYWKRIRLAPDNVINSWDKYTWQEFSSFRKDFCDFLELAYPLVGISLFEMLVSNVTSGLGAANLPDGSRNLALLAWNDIECSLYCLNGLADIIGTSSKESTAMAAIFSSSLWDDLSVCESLQVRQTAVNFIGSFDGFFETEAGVPYLPLTLSYLFNSLQIPNLSLTASKSIQKLCSSSRNKLHELIPSLFDVYVTRELYATLSPTAHERTVNSMACVIQSLESVDDQGKFVSRLLDVIIEQLKTPLSNPAIVDEPQGWEKTISFARCIVSIGKGLQVPGDLDHSRDFSPESLSAMKEFWNRDDYGIRRKVLETIKAMGVDVSPLNQSTELCEVCCDIFKAGLTEQTPNCFVFDLDTILTFISAKSDVGPISCVTSLVDLASRTVTSRTLKSAVEPQHLYLLLEKFSPSQVSDEYEPDVQVGFLELSTEILTHYAGVFISSSALENTVKFAVEMLQQSNRFVLRAAAQFWTAFVGLDVGQTGGRSVGALQIVGPTLVEVLVRKVAGDAARSDLDSYTAVIRKLVARHPLIAKPWFTSSIVDNPHRSLAKRDAPFRRQFVATLFNLRGDRHTNGVVREFWMACRGISDYARRS